jgi:DnaJ-class molecular chaperone
VSDPTRCLDCDGAGTGYRWGQDVDCSTCDGTGTVDVPEWADAQQEQEDREALSEAWDNYDYDRLMNEEAA